MVEVNKEYDSNAAHLHPDFDDSHLPGYGTDGNFGQPSVVYQVPIHIDPTAAMPDAQSTSQIVGYGDWTGADGRHQSARRHHLDEQSGIGRGAAAGDQRQQQRAQRPRAGAGREQHFLD